MTNRKRQQAIIDNRRQIVASLTLRGLSQRQIADALAKQDRLNPETGEPWALGTINSDVKALRKIWREEANEDIDQLLGDQLAEIREARRQSWKNGDMGKVYDGMKLEIGLLGTGAPEKRQITGENGNPLEVVIKYVDA